MISKINIGGTKMAIQDKFNKQNTIYKITKDIDLGGGTLTIPEGCTLDFQGGSFSNGTISGNNTKIKANLEKIFGDTLSLSGSWNIIEVYPEWFGAKGDGTSDDTDYITQAIRTAKSMVCKPWVKLCSTYLVTDTIYLPQFCKLCGNSSPSFTLDESEKNRVTLIANFSNKKKAILESDTMLNGRRLAYNETVQDRDFDGGKATRTVGIYIKDISIDSVSGSYHNAIYSAIKLTSSPSSIIENVFTKGTIIGIFGSAMWTTTISNCYILSYGYGIYAQSMNNGGLFNNYIDGYDIYSPFEFNEDEQIKDVYYFWNQDAYGFEDTLNKSYAIVLNYGSPICSGNTMEGWYGGYLIFTSQITLISDYFEKLTGLAYNMSYATGMIQNTGGYQPDLTLIRNSAYNNINFYNYTIGKMKIISAGEAELWSKINLIVPETKLASIPYNPVLNVEPVVDISLTPTGANYKNATFEFFITRGYKASKGIIAANTTVSTPEWNINFVRDVVIEGKGDTSIVNITNTVGIGDRTITFRNLKITGNAKWLFAIRNANVMFENVTFDYINGLSYHYESPTAKVVFKNCKFLGSKKLFSTDTDSQASIFLDVQNTEIDTSGSSNVVYSRITYETIPIE